MPPRAPSPARLRRPNKPLSSLAPPVFGRHEASAVSALRGCSTDGQRGEERRSAGGVVGQGMKSKPRERREKRRAIVTAAAKEEEDDDGDGWWAGVLQAAACPSPAPSSSLSKRTAAHNPPANPAHKRRFPAASSSSPPSQPTKRRALDQPRKQRRHTRSAEREPSLATDADDEGEEGVFEDEEGVEAIRKKAGATSPSIGGAGKAMRGVWAGGPSPPTSIGKRKETSKKVSRPVGNNPVGATISRNVSSSTAAATAKAAKVGTHDHDRSTVRSLPFPATPPPARTLPHGRTSASHGRPKALAVSPTADVIHPPSLPSPAGRHLPALTPLFAHPPTEVKPSRSTKRAPRKKDSAASSTALNRPAPPQSRTRMSVASHVRQLPPAFAAPSISSGRASDSPTPAPQPAFRPAQTQSVTPAPLGPTVRTTVALAQAARGRETISASVDGRSVSPGKPLLLEGEGEQKAPDEGRKRTRADEGETEEDIGEVVERTTIKKAKRVKKAALTSKTSLTASANDVVVPARTAANSSPMRIPERPLSTFKTHNPPLIKPSPRKSPSSSTVDASSASPQGSLSTSLATPPSPHLAGPRWFMPPNSFYYAPYQLPQRPVLGLQGWHKPLGIYPPGGGAKEPGPSTAVHEGTVVADDDEVEFVSQVSRNVNF